MFRKLFSKFMWRQIDKGPKIDRSKEAVKAMEDKVNKYNKWAKEDPYIDKDQKDE